MRIFDAYLLRRENRKAAKKFGVTYQKTVPLILKEIEAFEKGNELLIQLYGPEAKSEIIDSIIFYKYSYLDILDLINQLKGSGDRYEHLVLRLLAGTIYEFLNDTRVFLGKKFRRKFSFMENSEPYLLEFDKAADIFKFILEEYSSWLSDIRNNTAFHKTKGARVLKNKMETLDKNKVYEVILYITFLWIKIDSFHRFFIRNVANK